MTQTLFNKIRVPLMPTLHDDCFSLPTGAVMLAEMWERSEDNREWTFQFKTGNSGLRGDICQIHFLKVLSNDI